MSLVSNEHTNTNSTMITNSNKLLTELTRTSTNYRSSLHVEDKDNQEQYNEETTNRNEYEDEDTEIGGGCVEINCNQINDTNNTNNDEEIDVDINHETLKPKRICNETSNNFVNKKQHILNHKYMTSLNNNKESENQENVQNSNNAIKKEDDLLDESESRKLKLNGSFGEKGFRKLLLSKNLNETNEKQDAEHTTNNNTLKTAANSYDNISNSDSNQEDDIQTGNSSANVNDIDSDDDYYTNYNKNKNEPTKKPQLSSASILNGLNSNNIKYSVKTTQFSNDLNKSKEQPTFKQSQKFYANDSSDSSSALNRNKRNQHQISSIKTESRSAKKFELKRNSADLFNTNNEDDIQENDENNQDDENDDEEIDDLTFLNNNNSKNENYDFNSNNNNSSSNFYNIDDEDGSLDDEGMDEPITYTNTTKKKAVKRKHSLETGDHTKIITTNTTPINTASTSSTITTVNPPDLDYKNYLLRTMNEILTSQLTLTRKVDHIKDSFMTMNRRIRDIELIIKKSYKKHHINQCASSSSTDNRSKLLNEDDNADNRIKNEKLHSISPLIVDPITLKQQHQIAHHQQQQTVTPSSTSSSSSSTNTTPNLNTRHSAKVYSDQSTSETNNKNSISPNFSSSAVADDQKQLSNALSITNLTENLNKQNLFNHQAVFHHHQQLLNTNSNTANTSSNSTSKQNPQIVKSQLALTKCNSEPLTISMMPQSNHSLLTTQTGATNQKFNPNLNQRRLTNSSSASSTTSTSSRPSFDATNKQLNANPAFPHASLLASYQSSFMNPGSTIGSNNSAFNFSQAFNHSNQAAAAAAAAVLNSAAALNSNPFYHHHHHQNPLFNPSTNKTHNNLHSPTPLSLQNAANFQSQSASSSAAASSTQTPNSNSGSSTHSSSFQHPYLNQSQSNAAASSLSTAKLNNSTPNKSLSGSVKNVNGAVAAAVASLAAVSAIASNASSAASSGSNNAASVSSNPSSNSLVCSSLNWNDALRIQLNQQQQQQLHSEYSDSKSNQHDINNNEDENYDSDNDENESTMSSSFHNATSGLANNHHRQSLIDQNLINSSLVQQHGTLRHVPSGSVDQLELSEETEMLVSREVIKRCIRKAKHRGNFAANLAAELFTKEERITCNCTGTRGKRQLSPRRLHIVKDITFRMYNTNPAVLAAAQSSNAQTAAAAAAAVNAAYHEFEEAWRKECITAIDAKNRSIGRDLVKTNSSSSDKLALLNRDSLSNNPNNGNNQNIDVCSPDQASDSNPASNNPTETIES